MKKRLFTLSVTLGLLFSLAIPVGAADLHENQDLGAISCTTTFTLLHFVHNQHEGADPTGSVITVTFANSEGEKDYVVHTFGDHAKDKANKGTIHFYVMGSHDYPILWEASDTVLAGRIVLSDAKCKGKGSLVGLD